MNPVLPPPGESRLRHEGRPLTFQGFVVDALLELGLLHDGSAVAQEQQLAWPRLVAIPVVLGDRHGVLGGGRVAVNAPGANTRRRRFLSAMSLPSSSRCPKSAAPWG